MLHKQDCDKAFTSSLSKVGRRKLFRCFAGFTAAASVMQQETDGDDNQGSRPTPISFVDTNVSLFRWPFRRLPLDQVGRLVAKLRELGFSHAWAGSFEGILHRDLASVNQRLADTCAANRELVPVGSINLQLPGWKTDLDRCIAKHNMPAVRLHPNYHGYDLKDPRVAELARVASHAGILIQIAVEMEDPRTQHRLVRAEQVDVVPLVEWLHRIEGVRVQLLGHRLRGKRLEELGQVPGVYFDTARVDGTDGVAKLVDAVGADRILYGSHSPLLISEAALIRVYESMLDDQVTLSIMKNNAESVIATKG